MDIDGSDHQPLVATMKTVTSFNIPDFLNVPPMYNDIMRATDLAPANNKTSLMRNTDSKRESTFLDSSRSPETTIPDIKTHLSSMTELCRERMPDDLRKLPTVGRDHDCVLTAADEAFDRFFDDDTPMTNDDILRDAAERMADEKDVQVVATAIQHMRRARAISASVPLAMMNLHADVSARTLFDSGASYSLISESKFKELQGVLPLLEASSPDGAAPSFEPADGSVSHPLGSACVPLFTTGRRQHVHDERLTHTLWIMQGLSFDVILGCDFFAKHGVVIDYHKSTVAFNRNPNLVAIPFHITQDTVTFRGASNPLVVTDARTLAPGSQHVMQLRVLDGDQLQQGTLQGIVSRFARGHLSCSIVATTLSTMRDGRILVRVANITDDVVLVRQGAAVASFSPVTTIKHGDPILRGDHVLYKQNAKTESVKAGGRDYDNSSIVDSSDRRSACLAPTFLSEEPRKTTLQDVDLSKAKETLSDDQMTRLKNLLEEFSDIFADSGDLPTVSSKLDMKIQLQEGAQPFTANVRRLSPAMRNVMIEEVSKLHGQGVIERSYSPWNANVLLLPKKDGKLRFCLDYRQLNDRTINIASNLPLIQDNLDAMGGARVFTALDICAAYYGVNLHEDSRDYTAFFCPGLGQFRFTRASMGLKTSQQFFVDLSMRMLQKYIYEFVAIYADDLVIFSRDYDTHIDVHLRRVFEMLREYNLKLKPQKVELCATRLRWCGNVISVDGISPDPDRVKAVREMPIPTTIKELRSFLGAANFLRKWIPDFAKITSPLRPLLKKGQFVKPDEKQCATIKHIQDCLISPPVMAHPQWDLPWEIHADASGTAIGAALMNRMPDKSLRVVAVISKALTETQQNYATHEQEALAVLYALETWRTYIYGQRVVVWTDSSALTFLTKPTSRYQGRLMRWILRFSEFDLEVRHKSGVKNVLPDFLSRLTHNGTIEPGIVAPLTVTTRRQKRIMEDKISPAAKRSHEGTPQTEHHRVDKIADDEYKAVKPPTKKPRKFQESKTTQDAEDEVVLVNDNPDTKDPSDTQANVDKTNVPDVNDDEDSGNSDNTFQDVWESLFPGEEFDRDQLDLRPDVQLFHKIDDVKGLFVTRMAEDEWVQKNIDNLRKQVCRPECTTCTHHEECLRRYWRLSVEGVLYKRCAGRPMRNTAEQRRIKNTISAKCECKAGSSCEHYRWIEKKGKICPVRETTVVPKSLVTSVLFHFHGSAMHAHAGVVKTTAKITRRFYWKGITGDIRRWIGSCLPCKQRKTRRNNHSVFPGIMPLLGPWQTVALDFQGPFYETKRGNKYVLGIICTYSKWPICVPLPSRRASDVVRALLEHLICVFSCPRYLIADNAPEFIGKTLTHFCKVFNITKVHTPGYTPSLNPFIERYHGWQSVGMTILTSRWKDDWDLYLPLVAFSYRTSVVRTTGWSPFHLNFGREPNMPTDNVFGEPGRATDECEHVTKMESTLRALQREMSATSDDSTLRDVLREKNKLNRPRFRTGQFVLTFAPKTAEVLPDNMSRKTKMLDRWSEPKRIISEGKGEGYFIVQDAYGNTDDVRADSMIPYEFYYDNKPSVSTRRRFTKHERKALRGNPTVFLPPRIRPNAMIVFPLTMNDGTAGFGVGRAKTEIKGKPGEWDAQWYSNTEESLSGPFRPCWMTTQGTWYTGDQKNTHDVPLMTSQHYQGVITQDRVADVGFELNAEQALDDDVLQHVENHTRFQWSKTQ